MTNDIEKISSIFKVLADPTRLRIIDMLLSDEKACVYEIADKLDMSHSSISHQLSKLEMNNIVKCERDGQTMCYEIISLDMRRKLMEQIKIAVS